MLSGTLKEIPLTTRNGYDIYPATKTFLEKYVSKKTLDLWEESTKENYDDIKTNPKLRPYQQEGAKRIIKNKSFAIFDEQRLGKTPMLLAALKEIKELGNVLIIAPKSTLGSWKNECEKWFTNDVAIATGTKQQRIKIYNKNPQVILASYQTVYLDEQLLPKINCIVIDEAHRLRNFKGQRSKYSPKSIKKIMQISYKCERRYALTGTPAANKSDNIFPILHLLYPTLFTSYYQFADYYYEQTLRYLDKSRTKHILEIKSFKEGKQKELQEFLYSISIQRKRKEYMQWLPEVDKKEIYLKLTKKEDLWYNELQTTYECEELNIECPNLLSLLTALRKMVALSEEKKEWILNYLEDYPEEQIMIVSEFTSKLKELNKLIEGSKLLIGETKTEERTILEQDFNNKKYKVLLANITVAKEGMKLEQCNTIIMLDSSLTYTDNLQLEDRLLPTTQEIALQKDKQQIIKLLINNSIDTIVYKQLERKADYVEIINNLKEFLNNNS